MYSDIFSILLGGTQTPEVSVAKMPVLTAKMQSFGISNLLVTLLIKGLDKAADCLIFLIFFSFYKGMVPKLKLQNAVFTFQFFALKNQWMPWIFF